MAYEKQEWKTGDLITESKLNHIEEGIANAGGSSESEEPFEIIDLPTNATGGSIQFFKRNGFGYIRFCDFTKKLTGDTLKMTILYASFNEGMDPSSQLALDIAPLFTGTDPKNICGVAVDQYKQAYPLAVTSYVEGKGLVVHVRDNLNSGQDVTTINGLISYPLYTAFKTQN